MYYKVVRSGDEFFTGYGPGCITTFSGEFAAEIARGEKLVNQIVPANGNTFAEELARYVNFLEDSYVL